MKIVVIEPDGSGGMCHYAYMLCDALAREGADVTLLTATDYELASLPHTFAVDASLRLWPRTGPGTGLPGWVPEALQRPTLVLRRAWRAAKLSAEWWRVGTRLRRNPPDVVQIRELVVPGNQRILRRLRGSGAVVGQILHEIESRDEADSRRVVALFEQSDFDAVDVIFFHNVQLRDLCVTTRAMDPERTRIIAHGDGSIFQRLDEHRDSEIAERYGLSPGDQLVLMFGGLRASKGCDDLLRAFAELPPEGRSRLLIVGPIGRDLDPRLLPAVVDELGLRDRAIVDYRYVEMGEVAALMRRADVVVFPYRTATQSGVLATALTFGRPVVVTDTGGLPEVVESGRNGFVVPPADPPRLAAALRKILDDEALRTAMSAASLDISARFAWSGVAATVLDAYRELVDRR
jgi:glycosyltransferase involved in cell wall biosynthesis